MLVAAARLCGHRPTGCDDSQLVAIAALKPPGLVAATVNGKPIDWPRSIGWSN